MYLYKKINHDTVCHRSLDPFCIVTYYIIGSSKLLGHTILLKNREICSIKCIITIYINEYNLQSRLLGQTTEWILDSMYNNNIRLI